MSTIPTALLALVTFSSTFQTPQTAEDPAARAQAVLAALAAKDFARIEAQFDDRMKAVLPPGGLEAAWTRLSTQAGQFKSCGATRTQDQLNMHVTVTPCEIERAPGSMRRWYSITTARLADCCSVLLPERSRRDDWSEQAVQGSRARPGLARNCRSSLRQAFEGLSGEAPGCGGSHRQAGGHR